MRIVFALSTAGSAGDCMAVRLIYKMLQKKMRFLTRDTPGLGELEPIDPDLASASSPVEVERSLSRQTQFLWPSSSLSTSNTLLVCLAHGGGGQQCGHLVMPCRLAAVTDQLESANHLANSEETHALSQDDAAGDHLGSIEIPGLLEEVLRRSHDASVLDGRPQTSVEALEGGHGAGEGISSGQRPDYSRMASSYGGVIF